MTFVAALAFGVFVFFAVGFLTGSAPDIRLDRGDRPAVSDRQLWLIQAGVDMTPQQFWATSVVVGIAAFGFFTAVTGIPMVAFVPAVGLALLPRAYFARRRAQRLAEVHQAWPDGLRDLVASISSGMSLPKAVETLAHKGPEPLRRAFARFPLLSRTMGVVPALEVVKEEVADPTTDRIVEVLIMAYERGGAIVPQILQDLAEAVTRDLWTLEDIKTLSLEQKINARVVFVIPWLVLVALTAQSDGFREFYSSAVGGLVILVGGLLSLVGMWLIGRLSREPEEQRVLGGSALVTQQEAAG